MDVSMIGEGGIDSSMVLNTASPVIRHIFNLADAAAESEEKKIEAEQESTERKC